MYVDLIDSINIHFIFWFWFWFSILILILIIDQKARVAALEAAKAKAKADADAEVAAKAAEAAELAKAKAEQAKKAQLTTRDHVIEDGDEDDARAQVIDRHRNLLLSASFLIDFCCRRWLRLKHALCLCAISILQPTKQLLEICSKRNL